MAKPKTIITNKPLQKPGSGRKSAQDELSIIKRMDRYDPDGKVFGLLWDMVTKKGKDQFPAIKLWMEYRYGKPVQIVEQTQVGTMTIVYETDGTDNTFAEAPRWATGDSYQP